MSKLNEQRMAFGAASNNYRQEGLTKLELLSAMAMQGLLANPNAYGELYLEAMPDRAGQSIPERAVMCAKSLLRELEKENQ